LAFGIELQGLIAADDEEVAVGQSLAAEGLVASLLPDFLALVIAQRDLIAALMDEKNIAVRTDNRIPRPLQPLQLPTKLTAAAKLKDTAGLHLDGQEQTAIARLAVK